jgi:hypothetical protein
MQQKGHQNPTDDCISRQEGTTEIRYVMAENAKSACAASPRNLPAPLSISINLAPLSRYTLQLVSRLQLTGRKP